MLVLFSWDVTRPKRWVIIAQVPITFYRHPAPHDFLRRWVFMISRSAVLLFSVRRKAHLRWVRLLLCWRAAKALKLTRALRNIALSIRKIDPQNIKKAPSSAAFIMVRARR